MRIGPRAPALRAPSPAQNHFIYELFLASRRHKHAILFLPAPLPARYDRTKWPLADPSPRIATPAAVSALMLAGLALTGCAKKHHTVCRARSTSHRQRRNRTRQLVRPSLSRPPRRQRRDLRYGKALTAAHRTLPFGTWVRVVNLTNDKTVDVRIIDRGPFVENRIIDLSHAAAVAIDLIGPGVARVRLDILSVPTIASGENWYGVQAGAFLDPDRAERLRASLEQDFGPAHLVQRADSPSLLARCGRTRSHPRKPPPLWPRESGKNPVQPL